MPLIKPNQKIFLKIIFLFCFVNSLLINAFCVSDNNLTLTGENNMSEILKLEIKLGKHIYNTGEPILIECNIINIGQNSINLSPILFNDLEIYLKFENDKEFLPFGPKILLKERLRKEDIIKLKPDDLILSLGKLMEEHI